MREAFVLQPDLFNSELFEATIINEYRFRDNWDEIVSYLMNDPDSLHRNAVAPKQVCVLIDFNFDGVSIKNASAQSSSMWPILVSVTGLKAGGKTFKFHHDMPPFAVGYYIGGEKPKCNDIITEFVDELIQYNPETNKTSPITIKVDKGINDAPAGADLRGTTGHSGYWSLPRCIQRGHILTKSDGKKTAVYYPILNCESRKRLDSDWMDYMEPPAGEMQVNI